MAEIISMEEAKNKIADKETVETAATLLGALSQYDTGDPQQDIMAAIGTLLNMEDDKFEIIAPGILQSYLQSINNPTDKIALVQMFNASGTKSEDLNTAFTDLLSALDELDTVSDVKKSFLRQLIGGICNAVNDTEGISKKMIQVGLEFIHPDAKTPQYAHIGDSGADVFALDDYTILPGETKIIPTGLKAALPPGYELQVRPKSGRAVKTKLRVANTPGTIDANYRGEIGVIIENIEAPIKDITYDFDENGKPIITSILHGAPYYISKGEKFAQLVLMEVPKASFYKVEKVDDTDRGDGAYGSTGLK